MNAVVMAETERPLPRHARSTSAAARAATSSGWPSAAGGWRASTSPRSRWTAPRAMQRRPARRSTARLTWTQRDVMAWRPPEAAYDLVTVSFMHLPGGRRRQVYTGLAEAVAVGGSFLVAAHSPLDIEVVPRGRRTRASTSPAEELAADLDDRWEVVTSEARPRPGKHPDGYDVTLHDTVLRARRVVDVGGATRSPTSRPRHRCAAGPRPRGRPCAARGSGWRRRPGRRGRAAA